MREKLLYAIQHCSVIDNDFDVHGGAVLQDNDVGEDAQLEYIDDGEGDVLAEADASQKTSGMSFTFVRVFVCISIYIHTSIYIYIYIYIYMLQDFNAEGTAYFFFWSRPANLIVDA